MFRVFQRLWCKHTNSVFINERQQYLSCVDCGKSHEHKEPHCRSEAKGRVYQDELIEQIKKVKDPKGKGKLEKAVLQLKCCLDHSRQQGTLFICTEGVIEDVLELLESSQQADSPNSEESENESM